MESNGVSESQTILGFFDNKPFIKQKDPSRKHKTLSLEYLGYA